MYIYTYGTILAFLIHLPNLDCVTTQIKTICENSINSQQFIVYTIIIMRSWVHWISRFHLDHFDRKESKEALCLCHLIQNIKSSSSIKIINLKKSIHVAMVVLI